MDRLDDSSLKPSEVSARILSEHALLRPILRETKFLAKCLAKGEKEALEHAPCLRAHVVREVRRAH